MKTIALTLAIILAAAGGYLLVEYLTVPPIEMSLYLFLSILAIFSTILILATQFRGKYLLLASALALVSFAAVYLLQTNKVLSRQDQRPVPEITRSKDDPGDGHTAVIYFTHGEPETYDPIGWLNTFRELDESNVPFVPAFVRPFFIYQLRNAYLTVGQSHHRRMHYQMMEKLEKSLEAEGYDNLKYYIAFLDDSPRPDAAVIQALNEGASQIIVAEVFVSISNHTAEGEKLIKDVKVESYGVPVRFTGPFWNSSTLQRAFIDKAEKSIGETNKSKVGIILVGHGQPDEWDLEFPTETEQEISFRQQILELFEQDGYEKENLGLAWMAFKLPEPSEKVEELLSNGVEKIIYFAAAISADSIHSQYDIPELINESEVPQGLDMINMGAWNDHPLVIEAIKQRILEQMVQ